jgi:hypothetical protein
MGVGVLIGFVIIILLFVVAIVIFNMFRKRGKTKIGLIVSGLIIIFCVSTLFMNSIDSFTHSKKDVHKDLEYARIELFEDFDILGNEVTGMPERFQKTTLAISENDKDRIIKEIENSKDFRISEMKQVLVRTNHYGKLEKNKTHIANYKYKDEYVRESYYKKDNYVPIVLVVSLKKDSKSIEYERIED